VVRLKTARQGDVRIHNTQAGTRYGKESASLPNNAEAQSTGPTVRLLSMMTARFTVIDSPPCPRGQSSTQEPHAECNWRARDSNPIAAITSAELIIYVTGKLYKEGTHGRRSH
jgi:hypothetical protein